MSLQSIKAMKSEKGFTIVELLIVVVIIGILAAIVIVAYNGVTNRAKSSKSASTEVSLQKKLEAYNAENGNYPATYNLLTGAASTTSYFIAPSTYTLLGSGTLASTNDELTFDLYSCTSTPYTGLRIRVWDYANSAYNITYLGTCTAASTFSTRITS